MVAKCCWMFGKCSFSHRKTQKNVRDSASADFLQLRLGYALRGWEFSFLHANVLEDWQWFGKSSLCSTSPWKTGRDLVSEARGLASAVLISQWVGKTSRCYSSAVCIAHRLGNFVGGLASEVFSHKKTEDDWQWFVKCSFCNAKVQEGS